MTWQPLSRYLSLANVGQHVPVHANLSQCLLPLSLLKKGEKRKEGLASDTLMFKGFLRYSEMRSDLVEIWRKGERQRRKESIGGGVETKQPGSVSDGSLKPRW